MSNRLQRILIATVIATIIEIIMIVVFRSAAESTMIKRLAIGMGGDIAGGGYIQAFTILAFMWGYQEINSVLRKVNFERGFFKFPILPSAEHVVISDKEVNSIRVKVVEYLESKGNEEHPYFLLNMIKNVCTKFRANKSVSEALEIVNMQSRINQSKTESDQSVIRYIAWVIPSLGFIGTVLGIAMALEIAATAKIEAVTATLGVAFDTTLVALVLSIIYMWKIHEMQEENEKLHIENEEYVVKNLINKIDVS